MTCVVSSWSPSFVDESQPTFVDIDSGFSEGEMLASISSFSREKFLQDMMGVLRLPFDTSASAETLVNCLNHYRDSLNKLCTKQAKDGQDIFTIDEKIPRKAIPLDNPQPSLSIAERDRSVQDSSNNKTKKVNHDTGKRAPDHTNKDTHYNDYGKCKIWAKKGPRFNKQAKIKRKNKPEPQPEPETEQAGTKHGWQSKKVSDSHSHDTYSPGTSEQLLRAEPQLSSSFDSSSFSDFLQTQSSGAAHIQMEDTEDEDEDEQETKGRVGNDLENDFANNSARRVAQDSDGSTTSTPSGLMKKAKKVKDVNMLFFQREFTLEQINQAIQIEVAKYREKFKFGEHLKSAERRTKASEIKRVFYRWFMNHIDIFMNGYLYPHYNLRKAFEARQKVAPCFQEMDILQLSEVLQKCIPHLALSKPREKKIRNRIAHRCILYRSYLDFVRECLGNQQNQLVARQKLSSAKTKWLDFIQNMPHEDRLGKSTRDEILKALRQYRIKD